jgi:isocitrate dehydrogenase kinase/phosphatase
MVTATTPLPSSEIAKRIADIMIEGFGRHYSLFRETSATAKHRFEVGAWTEAQQAVRERIRFYDERVSECVDRLNDERGCARR